jgi:hypothetical protein
MLRSKLTLALKECLAMTCRDLQGSGQRRLHFSHQVSWAVHTLEARPLASPARRSRVPAAFEHAIEFTQELAPSSFVHSKSREERRQLVRDHAAPVASQLSPCPVARCFCSLSRPPQKQPPSFSPPRLFFSNPHLR